MANMRVELFEPFYPKAGNGWRHIRWKPCYSLMQHWYNLSENGAMEDALYEIVNASVCPVIPG